MKVNGSVQAYVPRQINTKRMSSEGVFDRAVGKAGEAQKAGNGAEAKPADLTNMTPMRMREWINDQIRSGNMTLDESTPFMGMTVGAEVDNSPVNYLQKIRVGIEAAVWRGDAEGKSRWEMALEVAKRYQYQSLGISTFA